MLRSRNLRASSQQDELQSLSLGLFGRPFWSRAGSSRHKSQSELHNAPEPTKPQKPASRQRRHFVLRHRGIGGGGVAQHARKFLNGDGGDIPVPLGSNLAPREGHSGTADQSLSVASSSYAIRLSIDLIAIENSHPDRRLGIAPVVRPHDCAAIGE